MGVGGGRVVIECTIYPLVNQLVSDRQSRPSPLGNVSILLNVLLLTVCGCAGFGNSCNMKYFCHRMFYLEVSRFCAL